MIADMSSPASCKRDECNKRMERDTIAQRDRETERERRESVLRFVALFCVYALDVRVYFVIIFIFCVTSFYGFYALRVRERTQNLPFFWFCSLKLYTNGCAYKMHREKSDYKKTFNPTKALVAAYKTEWNQE